LTKFTPSSNTIIALILLLIVLHSFSSHFYHIPLWDVIIWCLSNLASINNAFPVFLGLLFSLLAYFLSISGLINLLFLSLSGKKQELVYLGHIEEDKAVYYNIDDPSENILTGYDAEKKFNFSFNNLYRSQLFLIDSSSKGIGTKANRLHVFSFLSSIAGFFAFTLVTLSVFNILVHAAYVSESTNVILPTKSALAALDVIINEFGFSRKEYFTLISGLIFIWIGFNIATPKNKTSNKLEDTPPYIADGKVIKGVPNEISVRYVKQRRTTDSNNYDYVDSGERYINYGFKNIFKHTVYVATTVDIETNSEIINDIEHCISSNKSMDLILDEDLNIKISGII